MLFDLPRALIALGVVAVGLAIFLAIILWIEGR